MILCATSVFMKPNEIRAALVLRGITVTSIADRVGAKRPNVSMVISGARPTQRIRAAIAEAIGKPVDKVFPPDNKEAA